MAQTQQFGSVYAALPDDLAAERLRGLSTEAAARVTRALGEIEREDHAAAASTLAMLSASASGHPEVLRVGAVLDLRSGNVQRAIDALRQVLALRAADVLAYNDLGEALRASGNLDAAYAVWHRACRHLSRSAAAWFNLAWNLDRDGRFDEAREALEHVIRLAPDVAAAHLMLGDVLVTLGRIEAAAAEYRVAVRIEPDLGEAWCSLSNIKSVRFDAAELGCMEQLDGRGGLPPQAHAALQFALAKAYEDSARYADAFAMFQRANTRMRHLRDWDPGAFDAHVDEVIAAFSRPVACADAPGLGEEIIFIVGMPRSGSTLIEQILASHPMVEGADELPDLMQVIREESARRAAAFPRWVAATTPREWSRLGQRYLELTARWRKRRPKFTDKQPYNWLLIGAAQAMLPSARIIDCRRDPIETCWSCYQQVFPQGPAFSYDLQHIAAFLHGHDRAMAFWSGRSPGAVRDQVYEALLADPQGQVRELLAHCGLAWDPACLDFHRTERAVRSTSAAQVREPLRRDTARTAHYGDLLGPLRRAIGTAVGAARGTAL